MTDEHKTHAHKAVLSAFSPFFKSIFESCNVKEHLLLYLDVRKENILGILEYIYKGEVSVPVNQIEQFLKAASKLKISELIKAKVDGQEHFDGTTQAPRNSPSTSITGKDQFEEHSIQNSNSQNIDGESPNKNDDYVKMITDRPFNITTNKVRISKTQKQYDKDSKDKDICDDRIEDGCEYQSWAGRVVENPIQNIEGISHQYIIRESPNKDNESMTVDIPCLINVKEEEEIIPITPEKSLDYPLNYNESKEIVEIRKTSSKVNQLGNEELRDAIQHIEENLQMNGRGDLDKIEDYIEVIEHKAEDKELHEEHDMEHGNMIQHLKIPHHDSLDDNRDNNIEHFIEGIENKTEDISKIQEQTLTKRRSWLEAMSTI